MGALIRRAAQAFTPAILTLAFSLTSSLTVPAQDTAGTSGAAAREERARRMQERLRAILEEEGREDQERPRASAPAEPPDPALPLPPNPGAVDSAIWDDYIAALHEYYEYHTSGLRHRQKVFRWQLLSSRIIFVVVVLLVFAGIYFAAVQFHVGLGRRREGTLTEEGATELVASVKGIRVSSPVLGVIILVISLAFFYLYLVYVYPIEETF